MELKRASSAIIGAGLAAIAACQTAGGAQRPAVLASSDPETMAKVKAVLSDALGTARIELGAGDPTQTPSITVLPRPPSAYEGMSTAMPTTFDIVLSGGRCLLLRRDTAAAYELRGVACRPLPR
ncbi:MAG: hypothetical protein GC153_00100 [Alphaproteobacteria bacterium]|nr:hypothetical protein [Alphaproteobacteria bacterium]